VVFTIPFALSAFLAEPVYQAATVLADARADTSVSSLSAALGALGNLANVARINIPGATYVDEAMAVMRSREFTEGFIRDENLMPDLFPELWDAQTGQWRNKDEQPTLAQAFKVFEAIRSVDQAGRGGLVTVSVLWRDRVKAAEWANGLVARLNAEMRDRAIDATNLSVSHLEKELESTSTIETRSAINRLMEAQINQRMLANVTQEYAFRVIDRALPPEPDDAVGPSKLVLIALGPSVGLIFGVFAVLAANVLRSRRRAQAAI
jgi:uncharacterized protein involved in exopolysaccharide biosynthesis